MCHVTTATNIETDEKDKKDLKEEESEIET